MFFDDPSPTLEGPLCLAFCGTTSRSLAFWLGRKRPRNINIIEVHRAVTTEDQTKVVETGPQDDQPGVDVAVCGM